MKLYTYYDEFGIRIGSTTDASNPRSIQFTRDSECMSIADIIHGTGFNIHWRYKIKAAAKNSEK